MNHRTTRDAPPASLRLDSWLPLLLIAVTVAFYANGLSGPFVFDDVNNIVHDPRSQQFWDLVDYFRRERPIVFNTLAINYKLGGFNPVGYKVFNLIVHILAALTL